MMDRKIVAGQVWFDRNGSWRIDRQIHIVAVDTSGPEAIVTYRVDGKVSKTPAKKFSDPRYSLIRDPGSGLP